VFGAVAEREPMSDVNVITMKGAFAKKIEQRAIDNLMMRRVKLTALSVSREMDALFAEETVKVSETVYKTHKGISVIVNADTVDDVAIARVFEMVADALDQLGGAYGKIKFGSPVQFSRSELPWLTIH
jgi:phosphoglucomutase